MHRYLRSCSIVLQNRLKRTEEKLYMLSDLQEISRNVDTMALALPHKVPDMHHLEEVCGVPTRVSPCT